MTLHLGDCLDVMPTIPDASVDAIITDPPFKLSQVYGAGVDADNLLAVSSVWPMAAEAWRVAKPGAICAMFYDTRILPLALAAMQRAGWKYLRNITFYRRWGQASIVHGWMSTSDFILIFVKPGVKVVFHGPAKHDVYIKSSPEAIGTGHPAQKPLEIVSHLVGNITPSGGIVLDPYMGSGTTGEACLNVGCGFIGIESDPVHFATAERRIAAASTPLLDPAPAAP